MLPGLNWGIRKKSEVVDHVEQVTQFSLLPPSLQGWEAGSRNRRSTSISGGWMVGPTSNVSFNDIPVDDLADASNTALIFVVVLDSFRTACMGR